MVDIKLMPICDVSDKKFHTSSRLFDHDLVCHCESGSLENYVTADTVFNYITFSCGKILILYKFHSSGLMKINMVIELYLPIYFHI